MKITNLKNHPVFSATIEFDSVKSFLRAEKLLLSVCDDHLHKRWLTDSRPAPIDPYFRRTSTFCIHVIDEDMATMIALACGDTA